jgi:hypothetical protein
MVVMFAAIVFNWFFKRSTDSVILFLERYVLSLVIEKLILLLKKRSMYYLYKGADT